MALASGGGDDLLRSLKYQIVQHTRGVGIELGRGPFKAYPHFIGVRERGDKTMPPNMAAEVWVDSFDLIGDDVHENSLDFAFIWVEITAFAMAAVQKLLKVGGYLVVGSEGGVVKVQQKNEGGFLEDVDLRVCKWDTPTVCVVRYGAIGDTLQAASVLPELKRQGYHVTFMCEEGGQKILRNDPHIDNWLIQDKDQVPNRELPEYWAAMASKFDRFINLCESVEGALIKLPGRSDFMWPDELRREMCDHNYLEFSARMAELPFHPEHHFYPTNEEVERAYKRIDDIVLWQTKKDNPADYYAGTVPLIGMKSSKPFVIVWALAGSSVHKFYPHMDAVIARILTEIPNAHILLTGAADCKILEAGWENEPRVQMLSGELELRDSLALAQQAHLVIGPETGLLNAVAFETNAKIVFLSHSTNKNLTRDWNNTQALEPQDTKCYPCHRMHFTREFCPEEPSSGASLCQWNIAADRTWEAVQAAFVGRETVSKLLEPA